jgi:hypothetical protein
MTEARADFELQYLRCDVCTTNLRMVCKTLRQALSPPPSLLAAFQAKMDLPQLQTIDFRLLSGLRRVGHIRQPPASLVLRQHSVLPWDWNALSGHSEVLWLVDQLPAKPWDWKTICERRDISIAFVRRHEARLSFEPYFDILSSNPVFSAESIESNLDMPWSWAFFGANTSLDLAFYKRHSRKAI